MSDPDSVPDTSLFDEAPDDLGLIDEEDPIDHPDEEAPLDDPDEEAPLDDPDSADDLLESARETDDVPFPDDVVDRSDEVDTQGEGALDAELGDEGQGDLLPEDE